MAPFVPPHHDHDLIAEFRKFDEESGKALGYASSKLIYQITGTAWGTVGGVALAVCLDLLSKTKTRNAGHVFMIASGGAMLGLAAADGIAAKTLYPPSVSVEGAKRNFYKWLNEKKVDG